MSQRILSLIASATEIVCALGLEAQLVGRSHECDFPLSVKKLPQCTEPKFNVVGSSYEIDQRVKAILQEGLSVYRVFAPKLVELKPDVIITQIQCEVCAVSQKDVEEAVCNFLDSKPRIISLNPNALEDIWTDIKNVSLALGVEKKGLEVIKALQSRMEAIYEKTRSFPSRPRVAYVEWIEPLMAGGNWMPELVEKAGGINLFGEAGKHSPFMKWDSLVEANPDVILIAPCGFDIQRTRQEIHLFTEKAQWKQLQAVKNGKVFLADGNQFFNRPGPRVVEALETMAEILWPSDFHFGHENSAWEKL